ncbi:hypothetical protein JOC77_001528 [Peribacillus deserti]|uniref:Uncharacterized protein n=1 Tax=Peribacillus deserti TaxID=673318 RepID=A0ABS2QG14_9BACI|nr:hypothetical protein [Peribacillus deserti]MBM7692101.1 hypothetical protein [Peribacillus deserti]
MMRNEKRPVSYQQTLGTMTERAQLPEGYDISAFDEDKPENPTRESNEHTKQ